jgi:hypothetical protein
MYFWVSLMMENSLPEGQPAFQENVFIRVNNYVYKICIEFGKVNQQNN